MFVAGTIDTDHELIENVVGVMQAARVGTCPSKSPNGGSIQLGPISFSGPRRSDP